MTTALEVLSPEHHKHLHVDDSKTLLALEKSHLLQLRATEVSEAACTFPVFFTKATQQDIWTLSALCSFAVEQNLYVNESGWSPSFTPKSVKTQPLVAVNDDSNQQYKIAVNTRHPAVSTSQGEALFTSTGSQSLYLSEKIRLLHSAVSEDALTYKVMETFNNMGLISEVDMVLEFSDGSKQVINGLATVNENQLAQLDAQKLHTMQQQGELMVLHAILMSLYQVNTLIRLHNHRAVGNSIANIKFEAPKSRHAGDAI